MITKIRVPILANCGIVFKNDLKMLFRFFAFLNNLKTRKIFNSLKTVRAAPVLLTNNYTMPKLTTKKSKKSEEEVK